MRKAVSKSVRLPLMSFVMVLNFLVYSGLWILCQIDRPKVETGYDGWYAILDGA